MKDATKDRETGRPASGRRPLRIPCYAGLALGLVCGAGPAGGEPQGAEGAASRRTSTADGAPCACDPFARCVAGECVVVPHQWIRLTESVAGRDGEARPATVEASSGQRRPDTGAAPDAPFHVVGDCRVYRYGPGQAPSTGWIEDDAPAVEVAIHGDGLGEHVLVRDPPGRGTYAPSLRAARAAALETGAAVTFQASGEGMEAFEVRIAAPEALALTGDEAWIPGAPFTIRWRPGAGGSPRITASTQGGAGRVMVRCMPHEDTGSLTLPGEVTRWLVPTATDPRLPPMRHGRQRVHVSAMREAVFWRAREGATVDVRLSVERHAYFRVAYGD
jgi:hypothetical protein